MKPMNWEPMTEDAVFEVLIEVLVWNERGFIDIATYVEGVFIGTNRATYLPESITHFARITNPNEEKP